MIMLRQSFGLLNLHTISRTIFLRSASIKSSLYEKLGLPEKPKKPGSAFVYFFKTVKPDLTEKYPKQSGPELLKKAAVLWEQIKPDEKEKIKEMCRANMQKYKKELVKYNESLTHQQKEEILEAEAEIKAMRDKKIANGLKEKRLKFLEKPKKPINPFLKFFSTMKYQKGSDKQQEFLKKVSEAWKKLPESTKTQMKLDYDKELEKYQKELEKWEEKMIKEGNVDVVRTKTLKYKLQLYS